MALFNKKESCSDDSFVLLDFYARWGAGSIFFADDT
jgi:hypothetical protein